MNTSPSDKAVTGARLARLGVIFAVVSRLLSRIVGLLLVIQLARVGSDHLIASYGYLLGTASVFATFTDLGVAGVAGRDVAAGRYAPLNALRATLPIQIACGLLATAATTLTALTVGPAGIGWQALAATGLFVVANGVVNLLSELLRASGAVGREAIVQFFSSVGLMVLGIAAVNTGGGLVALMTVVASKELLAAVVLRVILPRHRPAGESIERRALLKQSLWVAASGSILLLLWREGSLVAGARLPVREMASFIIATRFLDAGIVVAHIVGVGLFPGFARMRSESMTVFKEQLRRYLLGGVLLGLIVGSAGVLLAEPVVTLLFSEEWTRSADAVRWVAVIGACALPSYIAWFALLAAHREKVLTAIASFALLIAAAGSLWLTARTPQDWAPTAGMAAGVLVLFLLIVPLSLTLSVREVRRPKHRASR